MGEEAGAEVVVDAGIVVGGFVEAFDGGAAGFAFVDKEGVVVVVVGLAGEHFTLFRCCVGDCIAVVKW